MTRQHFVAIADILGRKNANCQMISAFVSLLYRTNPRFDRFKFREAIEKARENAGWQNSYHVQTVQRDPIGI